MTSWLRKHAEKGTRQVAMGLSSFAAVFCFSLQIKLRVSQMSNVSCQMTAAYFAECLVPARARSFPVVISESPRKVAFSF